jgi:hypothetical protein
MPNIAAGPQKTDYLKKSPVSFGEHRNNALRVRRQISKH